MTPPLAIGLVLACIFLFYGFGMRYILTYRMTGQGLEASYFGNPVLTVPYGEIEEAKLMSVWQSFSYNRARRLGNKLSGPVLLVRVRSGLLKDILLTPENATGFLAELERRIKVSRQEI
jgi:hypothetical protein